MTFGGPHPLAAPVVRLNEFDTQEIRRGIIVGQGNWQQDLENNNELSPGNCSTLAIYHCPSNR
jgi:hypothetical protein